MARPTCAPVVTASPTTVETEDGRSLRALVFVSRLGNNVCNLPLFEFFRSSPENGACKVALFITTNENVSRGIAITV